MNEIHVVQILLKDDGDVTFQTRKSKRMLTGTSPPLATVSIVGAQKNRVLLDEDVSLRHSQLCSLLNLSESSWQPVSP
jgi:hypothetical protein